MKSGCTSLECYGFRKDLGMNWPEMNTKAHTLMESVSLMKKYICRRAHAVCVFVRGSLVCLCVCVCVNLCVLSEATPGRGSDIEDGLNPVLHSSGRP